MHLSRAFAIQLTKPDFDNMTSTGPKRKPLAGITQSRFDRILLYADTVRQAADQIEAMSLGTLTDPELPSEHQGSGGLNSKQMEQIVKNRTESAVAAATGKLHGEIAQLKADQEASVKRNADLMKTVQALMSKLDKPAKKAKKPGKVQQKVQELLAADEPPVVSDISQTA